MKNYIANGSNRHIQFRSILTSDYADVGPWDTSKALVRRTLERCIHIGRQFRAQGRKEDEYESYRLLGQAVCTWDSMLLCVWLMDAYFYSRCTPSRTSVHTRTFANLRLLPWVIPTYSCMSETTCAYKPLTVDGSLLWSLALSGPAILCSAFLAVSLQPTSKTCSDATNRGYRPHRTYWIFYPRGLITDKPARARLLFPISTKL
jgi:hypothetical protein